MTKKIPNNGMYGLITEHLFESYDIVYDICLENSRYVVYRPDTPDGDVLIQEDAGNFFKVLRSYIYKYVHCQDREYLLQVLQKYNLLRELQKNKYYSVVFRLMKNGKSVYYKIRATCQNVEGSKHIF